MIRLVSLLLILTPLFSRAEDALLTGGQSPDGHYQVRIYQTDSPDPSDYYYAVFDTKAHKILKQLSEGGGFSVYKGAKDISKVVWHPSSHFFALTDHGTRHSMEMYIYEVTPSDVTLLEQPDYYQNALGRVSSTEGYMTCVTKPLDWKDDVLHCNLFFDAKTADSPRAMFSVDFDFKLRHGDSQASSLEFTSMGRPTSEE
jgi:hypothetical protein